LNHAVRCKEKNVTKPQPISRRGFIKTAVVGTAALLASCKTRPSKTQEPLPDVGAARGERPAVSIVKIKDGKIAWAVEAAVDLLGGIAGLTQGKERIMLKPNLVSDDPRATTDRKVIQTMAELMKKAGKDVSIGEGSAAAGGFNFRDGYTFQTKNSEMLDAMQQYIFDALGYSEMARLLDVPLINLHLGEMVDVAVPGGFAYQSIRLHKSLTETDLLCSVPMMKTHVLATVTLGMKNLIGLYPGSVYSTVRAGVHDYAADAGSPGIAFEILDMVNANKLGLVVVDGSTAMEGDGPGNGTLIPMDVIIAGTNPLATDMVAASVMGFKPDEVPTFVLAKGAGMGPQSLDEIEIRGESVSSVKRRFNRPQLTAWNDIRSSWGVQVIP
jgi:uncharacterized protein (DUF362 family)